MQHNGTKAGGRITEGENKVISQNVKVDNNVGKIGCQHRMSVISQQTGECTLRKERRKQGKLSEGIYGTVQTSNGVAVAESQEERMNSDLMRILC